MVNATASSGGPEPVTFAHRSGAARFSYGQGGAVFSLQARQASRAALIRERTESPHRG